jgi:flagellar basal body P-ring protein FlgI
MVVNLTPQALDDVLQVLLGERHVELGERLDPDGGNYTQVDVEVQLPGGARSGYSHITCLYSAQDSTLMAGGSRSDILLVPLLLTDWNIYIYDPPPPPVAIGSKLFCSPIIFITKT